MSEIVFDAAFEALTGNPPFPWQQALYKLFENGDIPPSCNLPTGLGKTSVIAIWLIALANHPTKMPRRLVYVVNRRTVVDQTTDEVEKYLKKLPELSVLFEQLRSMCATDPKVPFLPAPLALSTLRGQFADNREWSADPSRPAVICGTVDMIGSRLLFSGYGVGFKGKPLHAGFLGQDALLVHDEAHLEPAFQELLVAIEKEQERCKEFGTFRVMELSATSRGSARPFELGDTDKSNPVVQKRIEAKKAITLHENKDEKKLAEEIAELALSPKFKDSKRAILIFVRRVDDVEKIAAKLSKDKQKVQQLTGTLRGLERDGLTADGIFKRFLPNADAKDETVYLICTSAGEVGVNISADHLITDLSTFESMAQRFGRVNRFGERDDTEIHILFPSKFEEKDIDIRRERTLRLIEKLNGNGSPKALGDLDLNERIAAFAPPPTILPVTDILFDAWALTSIRKLPGRPPVAPYLHGISSWEPPETHVAWREEVEELTPKEFDSDKAKTAFQKYAAELLEDYPLKPHELLRDNSSRVFDRLKKLKASPETPVWILSDDDSVEATTLGELLDAGKDDLGDKRILLPPSAGGLSNGLLSGDSSTANDVAAEWYTDKERTKRRRVRVWDDDISFEEKSSGMRLIRRIDIEPTGVDDGAEGKSWYWFELPAGGDSDGSKSNKRPVTWAVHTADVVGHANGFIDVLPLRDGIKKAVKLAAEWHDLGKRRKMFQSILGNFQYPERMLAKSGKTGGRVAEQYRHEFGSLFDIEKEPDFLNLGEELKELVRHLIAVHHGRGRPHFSIEEAFDPHATAEEASAIAAEVPRRFARLQRRYGRWGLAYLESLLRAADYAASASPSEFEKGGPS